MSSKSMVADTSSSAEGSARTGAGAVILCPGQGAQQVGMGRGWCEKSEAAREVFDEADRVLSGELGGAKLSEVCFGGPAERLNQTDVSQPAIYVCSVACWRGLIERGTLPALDGGEILAVAATAGLSLGEYTALHLAGVFDFATGLTLVATRGRLMQAAAERSRGSMVALIGADEAQAEEVCRRSVSDSPELVLVCANFNAPGQIVLSGSIEACERAVEVASEAGLRATPLTVAGAFHSPLMQPAADQMGEALEKVEFSKPRMPVYSNVTAEPHVTVDEAGAGSSWMELLRRRLVQQIVSPVRWAQTCAKIASPGCCGIERAYHELAPGSVLRGLMRRIDRQVKVTSHDEPTDTQL